MIPTQATSPSARSPEEVRAVLDEVLAADEFVDRTSGLQRLLDWFDEHLGLERSASAAFSAGEVLLWVLLALALLAIGILLWRHARGAHPGGARGTATPLSAAVVRRVGELRAAAAEAEREGDLVRALRLYFFALVVGLGERGDLAYRDAWTNRELLERGAPELAVERALSPLVGHLDEVSFGRASAGPEDVRRMSALSDELVAAGGGS